MSTWSWCAAPPIVRHLGVDNCAVVPNGYPEPSGAFRRDPATKQLLFVGPLTYEPNRLAVEWFIDAVLPGIRRVRARDRARRRR